MPRTIDWNKLTHLWKKWIAFLIIRESGAEPTLFPRKQHSSCDPTGTAAMLHPRCRKGRSLPQFNLDALISRLIRADSEINIVVEHCVDCHRHGVTVRHDPRNYSGVIFIRQRHLAALLSISRPLISPVLCCSEPSNDIFSCFRTFWFSGGGFGRYVRCQSANICLQQSGWRRLCRTQTRSFWSDDVLEWRTDDFQDGFFDIQ